MNFYCSRTEKNPNFGLTHTQNPKKTWNVYTDDGWTFHLNTLKKGNKNSWCEINFTDQIEFKHNRSRDFPIYYTNDTVASFKFDNAHLLPIDGKLVDNGINFTFAYELDFFPILNNETLNFNNCVDIAYCNIKENVESFLEFNNKEIYIPVQNGIDTLTIRSMFDHLNVSYKLFELAKEKPKLSKLGEHLSQTHWGFSQIKEIKNSVVVTGFYGDEWLLRNPFYVHALLSQRDINIINVFDKIKNCYMKNYFEDYRLKCSTKCNLTTNELMLQIYNDFQIWDLNSTHFFSPLKHQNLLQLLNADTNTIIEQVTDAKLSKAIIKKCNQNLLKNVDNNKNENDPTYFMVC